MDRIRLEKFSTNPDWRASYEQALAQAEAIGADQHDAIAFAAISADIATTGKADAEAQRERDLEATRRRLAASEAEAAAQAKAEPAQDQAQAAMARVVARMNASRGSTPPEDKDAAHGAAQDAQDKGDDQARASGAAAKAIARINAGR